MRDPKSFARWPLRLLMTLSIAAVAAGAWWRTAAAGADRPARPRVAVERTAFNLAPALSLDGGTDWINTAPIKMEELKGKVVLLDFWTYCCINCHHVLPDLAKLEEKYKNELVVIGVHTPKFFAERDTENIRRKVHEYQIKHPVINDADQVLWNRFGVNSWPTLVLIDPEGQVFGALSGEGHYAVLDRAIGQLVARHRQKGDLNTAPVKFFPESEKSDKSPLSFPGKVLADKQGDRLFIADTAHNRLVQTDLQGRSPQVIGNGSPALVDGSYDKAAFHRPQGMCLVDDVLYVADTENHAIRAVDLKARTVATVAGTGVQSHRRVGAGQGKTTALNSPWDLVLIPNTRTLAIAMAGIHQIWRYDIPSRIVDVWAGTGAENIHDDYVKEALFAQPSGLATDGKNIFVADSEVSAIREIIPGRNASVRTIVGEGLFVFDDVDGTGREVRLQHCLGLAYGNGKLYVADTYNNKIKVCNPATRAVETLVGNRQPGSTDDPPRFYQPGGLSVAGSHLYVADTDNGAIRVVDLKKGTVSTLDLSALKPPSPKRRPPRFPNAQVTDVPTSEVKPGESVTLDVKLPTPAGFKLNEQVPLLYLLETPEKPGILAEAVVDAGQKVEPPKEKFRITVPLAKAAKPGDSFPLKVSVQIFVCKENAGLCQVKSYVWNIPLTFGNDGASRLSLAPASQKE